MAEVVCGGYHTIAKDAENQQVLYAWGLAASGQLGVLTHKEVASEPLLINNFRNTNVVVADVACGMNHSAIVTAS